MVFLSGSRGPRWVQQRVSTLHVVLSGRLLGGLSRYNDGVLVHQLAGRVGEGGEGESDAVHLALIHALLMLLLQVSAPAEDKANSGQQQTPKHSCLWVHPNVQDLREMISFP